MKKMLLGILAVVTLASVGYVANKAASEVPVGYKAPVASEVPVGYSYPNIPGTNG